MGQKMAIEIPLHDRTEIAKVISISIFVLILFSICIIAHNPGVKGYEISIYDEYPMYFWYLIIFCIFICQMIIIFNAFSETASAISWKAAFIGIILCNSIVVLLPLIRGYALLGSGDVLTHMGYMLDIQHTGHIGNNTYPISHILGAISQEVCGFNLNVTALLYPSIFYIFFSLSCYLLFKIVLDNRTSIFIGMVLAPLMYFGNSNVLFLPQGFANFFVPFFLYLFYLYYKSKYNSANYALMLICVSIFITFVHPLTSLFIIIVLAIYDLTSRLIKRLNLSFESNDKTSLQIMLIMIVIFFTWQSYAYILLGTFKRVYAWFYVEAGEPTRFEIYSQIISEVKPDIFFIIKSFIFSSDLYGLRLLLMSIGVISTFIVLKMWKDKKFCMNEFRLMCLMIFSICFSIYIVSQFIIYDVGYVRCVHYAAIFSIILTPLALGNLLKRRDIMSIRYIKLLFIVFTVLSLCITYLSVFCVYTSPIIRSYGQHVTDSQLIGMNTFFEKRSEILRIIDGGISASRMKDALYGSKELQNVVYYANSSIPYHFNYTSSLLFGDYYGKPVYVIISKVFRISSSKINPEYPERWRFNQTDFFMLENDKSVSKVYSNQELDIYLLNPISE